MNGLPAGLRRPAGGATMAPEARPLRIWDVPPGELDRGHLLGEHRELHALWVILTEGRSGYRHHPETLRWAGRLGALYRRHEGLVAELQRRGYRHHSPLDPGLVPPAEWDAPQDRLLLPVDEQRRLLAAKAAATARSVPMRRRRGT